MRNELRFVGRLSAALFLLSACTLGSNAGNEASRTSAHELVGGRLATPTDVPATVQVAARGGYNVGWTAPGEWLAYRVNVETAAALDIAVRVATPHAGKRLHVTIDGVDVTGPMAIPNTGGRQTWRTISARVGALAAGLHSVRVVFDTDGVNVNWLQFSTIGAPTTNPTSPDTVPDTSPDSSPDTSPDDPTKTAGGSPCAGLCAPPSPFTSASFSASNLGSGSTCHETTAHLIGVACGNFASPRTFAINGVPVQCENVTRPAPRNGGYCFHASGGDPAWAWFSTW